MFLFGGKLYKCSDLHFAGPPLNPLEGAGSLIGWRENCVGNELAFATSSGVAYVAAWSPTAIMKPRVWANPEGFDFDNFANACQVRATINPFNLPLLPFDFRVRHGVT